MFIGTEPSNNKGCNHFELNQKGLNYTYLKLPASTNGRRCTYLEQRITSEADLAPGP